MLNWIYPEYWVWFLLLPIFVGALVIGYLRFIRFLRPFFSGKEVRRSYPALNMVLRCLMFLGVCLALLGPYWGKNMEKATILGREIFIVLDVSASMNITDVAPNRLDKAKSILKEIIEQLKGDKLGIILFADRSYLHCPLTQDYEALSLFLDMAQTNLFSETGTNIRKGLGLALERIQASPPISEQTTRAIILASDGEDFGDSYLSILRRLSAEGVKVFPIGIGTKEGGKVPSPYVQNAGFPASSHVISAINDKSLIAIAEHFNTPYTWIYQPYQDIKELKRELTRLDTSPIASKVNDVKQNRYQLFVLFSLLCWIISIFLKPVKA